MYYATVDPGTQSMGVAIWDKHTNNLIQTYLLTRKEDNWMERCYYLMCDFSDKIFIDFNLEILYCEQPKNFDSNRAAINAGAVNKLFFVVGNIAALCLVHDVEFEGIDVNLWKGQLPKQAVQQRIERHFEETPFKDDEWDAVGIGLYTQGLF